MKMTVSEASGIVRILLIEDSPEDSLLLTEMIGQTFGGGIRLIVVASLEAGIDHIRSEAFDAILLDLSLPDSTGTTGIRRIRETTEDVPVVIMTGLNDERTAIEALKAGAQDYLVKGATDGAALNRALRYAVERQRLHRQLLDSQKREHELRMERLETLGRLAGGIAHDFNNLLMGVMGNISLAKSAEGNERVELLAEAEKASERAASLTRQLLTFSKGGHPLKEVTAIPPLVREAVSFALRGANVSAQCELPDDVPSADIDPGQIAQVFRNIVINAVQAMPQGGHLRVRASSETVDAGAPGLLVPGRYIRITFEDEGCGIPEKHLPRIFDPYFTTKQQGSGLGLATALSVAQKHGGTITVDSVLGRGSSFHVYLPVAERPGASPAAESPGASGLRDGRILVMDDDSQLRELTARYLNRLGFEAVLGADGAEALARYREAMEAHRPFAAVIADLTVPGGMGGRELVQQLLAIDPNVKVIVSSGYSDDDVMSNHRDYGFCAVISKPYRMGELKKTLAAIQDAGSPSGPSQSRS